MPLLNLHLHTTYSDGRCSMREMAETLRATGHVALVTSDHDYCMTPEKYEEQLQEARQIQVDLGFPIICGLEVSLWYEEAVLISEDACRAWLKLRVDKKAVDCYFRVHANDVRELLKPIEHGLCLVHPGAHGDPELYRLFHYHEIQNGPAEWPEDAQEKLKKLAPQSKPVRGYDCHSTMGFYDDRLRGKYRCNLVEDGEWDEQAIIRWMKRA